MTWLEQSYQDDWHSGPHKVFALVIRVAARGAVEIPAVDRVLSTSGTWF